MMLAQEITPAFFLGLSLLVALIQMIVLRHDVAGDTYIHLTLARNLATGYGFSYNRGEPSNASTSPLWSVILGVLFKWVGQRSILNAGRVVAGICHLLSVFGLYFLVKQVLPGDSMALVAALLWALNPTAANWAMRAMETSLFILLILVGAIGLNLFLATSSLGLAVFLGIVLGLTILCRPEGWFWFGIATTCLLLNLSSAAMIVNQLVFLGVVLSSTFVVLLPYYRWMLKHFGTVFPSSKARILHHRQHAIQVGPFFFSKLAIQSITRRIYAPLLPFAALGAVVLYIEGDVFSQSVVIGLALFSIIVVAFYSFIVTGIDSGRYILAALPGLIILAVFGLNVLYQYVPFYVSLVGVIFIFALVVWQSQKELWRVRNFMRAYVIEQEEPVRKQMAEWVRDNLPEGVTIAAKEIDQLAFYSKPGQRILSMDGTIGGEVLPYLQQKDLLRFLDYYRPSHLLIEGNIYQTYPYWASSKLAVLASEQIGVVGDSWEIEGFKFILLHEETLYPYLDRAGRLRDRLSAWRLFSICYPSSYETSSQRRTDEKMNMALSSLTVK